MEIWNIRRLSGAWIAKNGFTGFEVVFNDEDIVSYLDDENNVSVFLIGEETPKWKMARSLWRMSPVRSNDDVHVEMRKHVGKCSPVAVDDSNDDYPFDD